MRILSLLFLFVLSSSFLCAQDTDPVKWSFATEKLDGDEYNLVFTAEIEEGWTTYSQFTSEGGPVPTTITFDNQEGIELLGVATEEGAKKEGFDKIFQIDVIKFHADKPLVITQKVKVIDASKPIIGYVTSMACDATKCLPPTDVDFTFNLNGDQGATKKKKKFTPVKWSFKQKKISETEYDLVYTADIMDGWTTYSMFTEQNGPIPTEVVYEKMEGIELVGEPIESGNKKEGFDKIFKVDVIKYLPGEPFTITQRIKVNDMEKPIKGYIYSMACDATKCLPPADFDFLFPMDSPVESHVVENTVVGEKVDQRREGLVNSYTDPMSNCGERSEGEKESKNLWWLLFAGILGGFAALMTPCVFPMIPITVSFFTKDTKRKGWVNGLIYGVSIIVIYVTLGLLITIFFGADALNALSTNWIANTIFFLIFIVFAFSFFGYYELTLPSSWTTKSDRMADKGGLLGIFFMAATLALVSFSCTGPIVGSALVAAANGGNIGPAIVMFGFSLALALPFGLFAAFPAWLNSLPKSGGWMNSVKVVLGFLELGFAFKFLSTADLTQHWGILKYETFMFIIIAVCVAIAIYLFGFIKFPHDSPIKKLSFPRKAIATSFLLMGIYLCFGFTLNKDTGIYNSLWLTSGFSPPVNYNMFLTKEEANKEIKARYPSFSKCANNIDCFKDYFEGLSYAKEIGKPAFIDFTGHGCQNCRRVEDQYWVKNEIREFLNDDVVLISLYVDDREPLEKTLISIDNDKKLRTVGSQWADFEAVNFSRISQPWYVMITPEEKVITHPRGYDYFNTKEGAKTYQEYLECGLESFEQLGSE